MIEYEKMMYSILNKYHIKNTDDYIDICYIGYVKALNKYDETKATFSTFVYKCMDYELLSFFGKENTDSRKINKNILSIDYKYEDGTIQDTLSNDEDIQRDIIKQETVNELYSAIFKLGIRDQYIILNSFNLIHCNKNISETCKKLEISKARFYILRSEALVKLKKLLDKNLV